MFGIKSKFWGCRLNQSFLSWVSTVVWKATAELEFLILHPLLNKYRDPINHQPRREKPAENTSVAQLSPSLFGLFVGLGSGPKTFLGLTCVDNQYCFWKYSAIFLFLILQYLGGLLHFFLALWGYLFGPLEPTFGSGSGPTFFWESINVDYQFLFWKHCPIFLFFSLSNLGPFFSFWAIFGLFVTFLFSN